MALHIYDTDNSAGFCGQITSGTLLADLFFHIEPHLYSFKNRQQLRWS
jgi:hypothetical protein